MTDESVTQWIERLAGGDEDAAQRIWERYCEQLVHTARKKLGAASRRVSDEEDVALSAFDSFCRGISAGRFPRLDDRQDLWKMLLTITTRKATAQWRREHAQKRGGGAVRGESVFLKAGSEEQDVDIDAVPGDDPAPDYAVLVAEECEHLLDALGDDALRKVALMKLEGYSNVEIKQELGCSIATVERKLTRIREKWEQTKRAG
jgi:DNA-directed RNA polymerase specialized sigma24 family protein